MKDGKAQEAEEVKAKVAVYKENDKLLQTQMAEANKNLRPYFAIFPTFRPTKCPKEKTLTTTLW